MDGFGASTYGDGFAEVYDRWDPDVTDTSACVELLAELARATGGGRGDRPEDLSDDRARDRVRVLELGVGTGRLALPLAGLGLAVTGVDASTEMLARLAAKPGADRLAIVVGDMADLDAVLPRAAIDDQGNGAFALAFAAYNTLFNLPTVEAQGACIRAVADRLRPGGRLVIEGFVPADDPTARRDDVAVSRIDATELVLTATLHDRDAQTISGQHVQITETGIRLRPWLVRYLLPTQLDEVAGAGGLELEHRWSDWRRAPFDDTSPVHVSVYRRTP
ncbi:MAG: class I SAM-dependent DNA methyltransferase [Acidimicrobiales bacterium]